MDQTSLAVTPAPELALAREGGAAERNPRCNIPFNLDNWRNPPADLDPDKWDAIVADLTWFHQHILDQDLTYKQAAEAIAYDTTVVFRVLKGTYAGSWDNIVKAIDRYRRSWRERSKIQNVDFAPNRNTKLIWQALDYCVASNRITTIIGESGMSKTTTIQQWRDQNNSGRTILIEAPVLCTPITLGARLCKAIGRRAATRRASEMFDHVEKALTKGRTLIIDEAHRLLPRGKADPVCLELLRELHDHTKCGLALVATMRFEMGLRAGEYQFEQILGRIGLPCRLARRLTEDDIKPIVLQYFKIPSDRIMTIALKIANAEPFTHRLGASPAGLRFDMPGRLRSLVELFRHASKATHDLRNAGKTKMTEDHLKLALDIRAAQMGEALFAEH